VLPIPGPACAVGPLPRCCTTLLPRRHTKRPWVRQLVALVPALNDGMTEDHSQVGRGCIVYQQALQSFVGGT
jgi:hypothetical protein